MLQFCKERKEKLGLERVDGDNLVQVRIKYNWFVESGWCHVKNKNVQGRKIE
jgi:hypothetical protein